MDDGKMLILQRAEENEMFPGWWDTPGGTLEDGEDPIEGAKREAREEAGLSIHRLSLFFYDSRVDRGNQFITLVFLAEPASDPDCVRTNPGEHDAFQWCSIDELGGYELVPWLEECLVLKKDLLASQG